MAEWDAYNAKVKKGDKDASRSQARPETRSPGRRAARQALRADPLLPRRRIPHRDAIAKEYGYKIRAFHHALEIVQGGRQDRRRPDIAIATFADWWGFKDEAWDAIPWNAVISMRKGVRVASRATPTITSGA